MERGITRKCIGVDASIDPRADASIHPYSLTAKCCLLGNSFIPIYRALNCQNATALAAATFRLSTPCCIGIMTV